VSSTDIHPTAIVEAGARLGAGVKVGPYALVGPEVELGDGVVVHGHAVIAGRTRIGRGSEIFPFASIGHRPQDLKYRGEPSALEIGERNVIREHVTMNPGTEGGGMLTRVGNGCLFMMGAHVAHDCKVGDNVIMANNATLAGHVSVGDHVIMGGLAAVLQFGRIGKHAIIGGLSGVEQDIIPFGMVTGNRGRLIGLNLVGLKRHNFARESIDGLRRAYRQLFGAEGTFQERLDAVAAEFAGEPAVMDVVGFIRAPSTLPICQPGEAAG
jgi:UDP-N-acetylglucosamine acyltransferase